MSLASTGSSVPSVPSSSVTAATSQPSFFGSNVAYKLFSSSSAKPDPDQEGIIWDEPEVYSAVISRKEHSREHVSLLSLRDVLRNKTSIEGSNGLPSRIVSMDNSRSRNVSGVMPPSALVKSAVEHVLGGQVSGLPDAESAGKLPQEMEAASMESSQVSSMAGGDSSKSQIVDAHIHAGQASSLLSGESDSTIGPDNGDNSEPPALPPKDIQPSSPAETSSFFNNSLTNAVRYMLNTGDLPRSVSPSFKNQHNTLVADSLDIDDRPHIKYDWMIGKRLKYSCTVYYAKQFESLRRRCGIEDVFLSSLGRSTNFFAEGGKSKSNFWKTSDDRFIIKTLVNAWNVDDL
jgi:1-phosphatidylinositol-3-phosphate 5-kinase